MRPACLLLAWSLAACARAAEPTPEPSPQHRTAPASEAPSVYGMQSLSLKCETAKQLEFLKSYEDQGDFDFVRFPRTPDDPVEVLVAAGSVDSFKEALQDRGIPVKVLAEDVSQLLREQMGHQGLARSLHLRGDFISNDLNLEVFPRYDEIKSYTESLASDYSGIVSAFSIGKSFEGRDILAVKISSGGEDKPALLIDAGIHAREWIAPTTALYAIKQLVENATNHAIFRDIDVYVIPLLNPDGYEYTHLNEQTRLWRKTRSDIPGSDCKGVDANRNFDIHWMSVGSSPLPCTTTYAGSRPFSEPETRALRDFVLARRDRIRTYLSLHSHGNYILHPWGFTPELPANEGVLRCAAEAAARELHKVHGTNYRIGSSTNVLYAAAGGSDDWTMATAGVDLAYTMELPGGRYAFAPPPNAIIPVGLETFEAIKVFARYVAGGICQRSPERSPGAY